MDGHLYNLWSYSYDLIDFIDHLLLMINPTLLKNYDD